MADNVELQQLLSMGYSKSIALEALAINKNDVIAAVGWLCSMQEQPPAATSSDATDSKGSATLKLGDTKKGEVLAQSLICQDCGKVLKSETEAQAHAARTEHKSFSESSEKVKPLTENERAAKLAVLQEAIAAKRKAKEEKEREEAIEREKARREQGKAVQSAKEYYKDQQILQAAKELREEKIANRKAKERIREEIKKDQAERAAKHARGSEPKHTLDKEDAVVVPSVLVSDQQSSKKEYSDCYVQIRLPDGQKISHTFKATDPLSGVYNFVAESLPSSAQNSYTLGTIFPRKDFNDSDKEKTLAQVKLVPSATLVVSRR
eukprot:CFRG0390T1